MGEAAGADERSLQDYLLRELMSEGVLRYPTAMKVGASVSTVTISKDGPVSFLVTTTRTQLHHENETRMLSLEVDASEEQTVAVLRKVAQNIGTKRHSAKINYESWRDFQRWLAAGQTEVVVPFAEILADAIRTVAVRTRRDFTQTLVAIQAHALIHRSHRKTDAQGRIIADIEHDYATTGAGASGRRTTKRKRVAKPQSRVKTTLFVAQRVLVR